MEKKTKEEVKKRNKKGELFYESIPVVQVAPREISLPRVSLRTAEFIENVIIFFSGTAVILILMRVVLMMFGVKGGNLLTYLLYAASYPFVMIFTSGQGQVPPISGEVLFQNLALVVAYSVVSYGLIKMLRALSSGDKKAPEGEGREV